MAHSVMSGRCCAKYFVQWRFWFENPDCMHMFSGCCFFMLGIFKVSTTVLKCFTLINDVELLSLSATVLLSSMKSDTRSRVVLCSWLCTTLHLSHILVNCQLRVHWTKIQLVVLTSTVPIKHRPALLYNYVPFMHFLSIVNQID